MPVNFYRGDGQARSDVALASGALPADALKNMRAPQGYRPNGETVKAVNVALALNMPLLIGGEPGSGKTLLGDAVALELGKTGPFKFITKSTSQARDLFYTFDAVRYFQAKPRAGAAETDPKDFIEVQALGLAILLALPLEARRPYLPADVFDPARDATVSADTAARRALLRDPALRQSLVIVDEVDKAPRDFPNDILDELENMRFRVPELGGLETPTPASDKRPIVFLTTNSERQLPDAFLRRCAFLHIDYPRGADLEAIVAARLTGLFDAGAPLLKDAVAFYSAVRARSQLSKPPGTAELLQFLRAARVNGADPAKPIAAQADVIANGLMLLAKTKPDIAPLQDALTSWRGA
jgi:MoxR-like ATPase